MSVDAEGKALILDLSDDLIPKRFYLLDAWLRVEFVPPREVIGDYSGWGYDRTSKAFRRPKFKRKARKKREHSFQRILMGRAEVQSPRRPNRHA